MKVRMQKLNMVHYACSDAEVKGLEQQGYKKSPIKKEEKPSGQKPSDSETGGKDG